MENSTKKRYRPSTSLSAGDIIFNTLNYTFFILFTLMCVFPFFYLFINTISDNDIVQKGLVDFYPKMYRDGESISFDLADVHEPGSKAESAGNLFVNNLNNYIVTTNNDNVIIMDSNTFMIQKQDNGTVDIVNAYKRSIPADGEGSYSIVDANGNIAKISIANKNDVFDSGSIFVSNKDGQYISTASFDKDGKLTIKGSNGSLADYYMNDLGEIVSKDSEGVETVTGTTLCSLLGFGFVSATNSLGNAATLDSNGSAIIANTDKSIVIKDSLDYILIPDANVFVSNDKIVTKNAKGKEVEAKKSTYAKNNNVFTVETAHTYKIGSSFTVVITQKDKKLLNPDYHFNINARLVSLDGSTQYGESSFVDVRKGNTLLINVTKNLPKKFLLVLDNQLQNKVKDTDDVVHHQYSVNISSRSTKLGLQIGNYIALKNVGDLFQSFLVTLSRTILGTALMVLASCFVGYLVTKKEMWARKFWYRFLIITMYFNAGIIPWFMTMEMLGLTNNYLAYIIPAIVQPYNIILVKTYIESIPAEMEESAAIDGASYMTIFTKIIWPLAKPILATIAIFGAVGNWNSFQDSLILMQANPKLFTLQHILYNYLNKSTNLGALMSTGTTGLSDAMRASLYNQKVIKYTISMVTAIPILLVYPFMQKYFVKGIMLGAVKG